MLANFLHHQIILIDIIMKGKKWFTMLLTFLFGFCPHLSIAQKPVIIEFGWDYPDVKTLHNQIDSMQNTSFNGISFSLQRTIMEAFDTVAKTDGYFELNKLTKIKWGKYTDNFIIVRGYSKTGGNWFDDSAWITIEKNTTGLSKAIKAGRLKGILFDPEYYYTDSLYNPWTFTKSQYPNNSFNEVKDRVKLRGIQFVSALQKHSPSFTFLSLWITSLIAEEKKYNIPVERTKHALLIPFIEGMLEGKKNTVIITDGNEFGYWNNKPSQFAEAAAYLNKNLDELLSTKKAKLIAGGIKIAQPIFYDGLMAKVPLFNKGADNQTKWTWLDENIKQAFASTDNIVWFYSERVNWWQDKVNDTLVALIEKNKDFYWKRNTTKKNDNVLNISFGADNINSNKGYFYNSAKGGPVKIGGLAFTYKWNSRTKKLSIKFIDSLPVSLFVYTNNNLKKNITPKKQSTTLTLPAFYKGRIIILLKYKNNTEAAAIKAES